MTGEIEIQKYAAVMKEIKLRIEVINAFTIGKLNALYAPPTLESIGLQFRKCFELIAFASLVANKDKYSSVYKDFGKHWEAAKLFKNLKEINPDFYPKPVVEGFSTQPGVKSEFSDRKGDVLTEADLIEAHGKCGALLHSVNPFRKKPFDYPSYESAFRIWLPKTMNLLNSHKIHLVNDPGFYLVHMKEEGHDEISWYRFLPAGSSNREIAT